MLTLQFGQCGNQLGHALFSKLSADIDAKKTGVSYNVNYNYIENVFDKWFSGLTKDGKRLARAILMDTEEKVINKITDNKCENWTYCTNNIFCQAAGGSGNNWAYGYMEKGIRFYESVSDIIQCEIEKVDHLDGFLFLLSSSGGMGSGIGSYIIELMRDEYKNKSFVSTIILPFLFGEISTQNYNTLLTLVKFLDNADTVFLFENEDIHFMLKNLSNVDVKLEDINDVISKNLSVAFQPISNTLNNLHSLMSKLVVEPCYKLATIKTVPILSTFTEYNGTNTWHSYLCQLKRMLKVYSTTSDITSTKTKIMPHTSCSTPSLLYSRSISNVLITRGNCNYKDIKTDELKEKYLYADWVTTDSFTHFHQQRHILNHDKALALLTNNSNIYNPINKILDKAWNSYTHSAFLHHYKKFGLEDDDFLKTFAKIENVIKDYKKLGEKEKDSGK
ncbi:hypothetical protein M0804_012108 [Polistes exclamans]|nr:hypothetical protein M0804_012108 [Polistes exclamans]